MQTDLRIHHSLRRQQNPHTRSFSGDIITRRPTLHLVLRLHAYDFTEHVEVGPVYLSGVIQVIILHTFTREDETET